MHEWYLKGIVKARYNEKLDAIVFRLVILEVHPIIARRTTVLTVIAMVRNERVSKKFSSALH